VKCVLTGRNLAGMNEARFELHPDDFLAADSLARRTGLEIVGIYHSHPDAPASPSRLDRQNAQPGWSHVILALAGRTRVGLRSFRLDTATLELHEESVECPLPDDAGTPPVA